MMVRRILSLAACVGVIALVVVVLGGRARSRDAVAKLAAFSARGGEVTIAFDNATLDELGWRFISGAKDEEVGLGQPVTFQLAEPPSLHVSPAQDKSPQQISGSVRAPGGLLLIGLPSRVVIGNLQITAEPGGAWTVKNTLGGVEDQQVVFRLTDVLTDVSAAQKNLRVFGELTVDPDWAAKLGAPEAANIAIGTITMDVSLDAKRGAPRSVRAERTSKGGEEKAGTTGPDIIVADLQSVLRFGRIGDITAFAVGTTSCNLGDARASWVAATNEHPVIGQGMFRLKDNQFEQIGLAWVKHGFYAVNGDLCGTCYDETQGAELGIGCSDPYDAYLNGTQGNMSQSSGVNPYTGAFDYHPPWPQAQTLLDKRLQVHDADLDPEQNPGAAYFVQGQYISADEALAGNGANSISYRRVIVNETPEQPNVFLVYTTSQTHRTEAAVQAWKDADSSVTETPVQVPAEGLFILAAKATDLNNGFWHYEYALENVNSDRGAGVFQVPIPDNVQIENVGFHDVDYHSGEIYDGTDWDHAVGGGWVGWWTEDHSTNPNANALRFGTVYNFRFDATIAPGETLAEVGLFKPGLPASVPARTIGPSLEIIDCNRNSIEDRCEIQCGGGCVEPCGFATDCNNNTVPDDCEPDCNGNGITDYCDIRDCAPGDLSCADCEPNGVPDGCQANCQTDCDEDGILDTCETLVDTDQDGILDCEDLCPFTTPPDTCVCPPLGLCCWDQLCIQNYSRDACIANGGVPDCLEAPCRDGCPVVNVDKAGDMVDVLALQRCYSGSKDAPTFIKPRCVCLARFDLDGDGDVDGNDYALFNTTMAGP